MRRSLRLLDDAARRWIGLPARVRILPPLLVMALLWWSSSRPAVGVQQSVSRSLLHNAMHVVVYGALGASLLLALYSPRRPVAVAAVLSFAIAVGYGLVDELHQSAVPGRVCSMADLAADAAGAALALTVVVPRLLGVSPSRTAVGWCVLVCLLSVALATWSPW
jgi:VanZ family protein